MTNEMSIGVLAGVAVIVFTAGAMFAYVRMRGGRIGGAADTIEASMGAADSVGAHHKPAFRTMAQWYSGKQCAICGRDIAPLSHFGPEPGLMSATSPTPVTVAWTDVSAEQLPDILDTHRPVCSSCHLMTWFQHEHPDLLIDRHRTQETDTVLQ